MTNIDVKFIHGLGDCAHFAMICELYRRHGYAVRVACEPNKKAFFELCGIETAPQATAWPNVPWHDPPALVMPIKPWWLFSKAIHNIGRQPLPDIGPHDPHVETCLSLKVDLSARVDDVVRREVATYMADMSRLVLLLHTKGNTNQDNKSIPDAQCPLLYDELVEHTGGTVVLLDWDNRVPRGLKPHVRHPADEGFWLTIPRLVAILGMAGLIIGVDSGPLHLARLVGTKALGVWRGNSYPARFALPRRNQVNLVIGRERENAQLATLFNIVQHPNSGGPLDCSFLAGLAAKAAVATSNDHGPWPPGVALAAQHFDDADHLRQLTSRAFDRMYYEEHRLAGLDYLSCGDWQRDYGQWLTEAFDLRKKRVLDVGCACGAIVRGFHQAGVLIQGVDVSEHMIALGRSQWRDMERALHVCDAVRLRWGMTRRLNLHLFTDETFDALHSAQVAEHWKPDLVPLILRELHRVTKPGGVFWCSLDTQDSYHRQGRKAENEDPTHYCMRPLDWWHQLLHDAGWTVCTEEFRQRLAEPPGSFLRRYDWDWFVARRL